MELEPEHGQHFVITAAFANLQTKNLIQLLTKLWYGIVHGARVGIPTLRYLV
jgi:hypothetical protein